MTELTGLDDFVAQQMPAYKSQLAALVAIPSISCEPAHDDDCIRVVQKVGSIAESIGFTYQLVETAGHPALVAYLEVDPSAPTVTVYNHLDTQPVEPSEWSIADPFSPVTTADKIIGRGTTDDKGPMLSILYAVKYLKESGQLPVNVQLVFETEEEIGSNNFGSMLDQTHTSGLLKPTDSILISDTIFEGDSPAITYKLRGVVSAKLRIEMANGAVHSGIAGGFAVNPIHLLSEVIADCVDAKSGTVKIPGFYSGMTGLINPSGREREAIETLAAHTSIADLQQKLGWKMTTTDDALTALYRMGHLPTFEVHRTFGSQKGNMIPPYAEAGVSMRLAIGQDPNVMLGLLGKYLQDRHPYVKYTPEGGIAASVTSVDNPFIQNASNACVVGYGKEALTVASGGSIGSVLEFQRVFPHAPNVLIAQSKITDGYHAPNEQFEWKQAEGGIKTMAAYIHSLGDLRTR